MKAVKMGMWFYAMAARWAGAAVMSALLLMMRVIWGYQFFLAGSGKLKDISKPIQFFTDLHIPMPVANAWLVACVETFGGLLLLVGLGSRAVAFALTVNMVVALLTADHEAVAKLFGDGEPGALFGAAPFWFLVTALLVLANGPGWISVDGAIKGILMRLGIVNRSGMLPAKVEGSAV